MKYSVIIPIEKNDFFDNAIMSLKPFCRKYKDSELIFVLSTNVNCDFFKKNKKYKAIVIDKFTINNAIEAAIPYVNGDNLLIADQLVNDDKIYLQLADSLEADNMIVNTRKKGKCFKLKTIYYDAVNFFNKVFISKEDAFANQTLQCIGKDILDVIKKLPQRVNVIKNCLNIAGCEYKTIDYKEKTSKTRMSGISYILFYVFLGVLVASILTLILTNTLTTVHISINIIMSTLLILSFLLIIMCYPRAVLVARLLTSNYTIVSKINIEVTNKEQ